jgi:ATP-binding cassette, subfamily B, multidrug efflux pump
MRRLLSRFLRPYAISVTLVVILVLLQAVASLYLPDLNADIINNGVAKGDMHHILVTGVIMLFVSLGQTALTLISMYLGARTSMGFGRDVRSTLFRHVSRLALTEVNRFGTPSLITRNTNDVQQVQQVVMMGLTMMLGAPLLLIGGIIMAVRQDLPLSGLLVVVLPVMAGFIAWSLSRAMPLFRAIQTKTDRLNRVVRETLAGVRVIRAFVRNDFELQRFDAVNEDLTDTAIRVNQIFALMIPALFGILNLATVAVIWFGGLRIASGAMPIGNLTAFLTYIMQILMSVMMATLMFSMVPRAAASADRIQEVLDTESSVSQPTAPVTPSAVRGVVEFEDAEFRYPHAQEPVLRDIRLTALPGEVTAIIGSTGSGKSTLVNLIPRLFDVTAGRVRIDGVDVRQLRFEELWPRIGFVPQRAFLFAGTIASNVRFGREEASDDDVWRALEIAQARDFVSELPERLDAPVTQGGTNLSGGQRQRLAIARAVLKRPPIYVLDDCFSALDFATDARLRAALADEATASTVIVVAQRVSTIVNANRIIVMDGGRIAATGTHAELMTSSETYREIVFSQIGQEEVA